MAGCVHVHLMRKGYRGKVGGLVIAVEFTAFGCASRELNNSILV